MNSKVMLMAALAVCGCASLEEGNSSSEGEMVELSFSVPCQKTTKVSGSVAEDAVKDLQIFVFGKDGMLHGYGHAESDELTLTCSTGEKRIAAVVNAPAINSVTDESTFQGLVSSFSDNSIGRFVMSGSTTKTVQKGEKITIPVSRLISKVILSSVKNDLELQQHRTMDFKVKSVFLTNAAKNRKYFSASSPTDWYNKGVSDISQIIANAGTMMYESLGSSKIAYGTTYQSEHFLYCYPNPRTDGAAPTYMVVEAMLGQSVYYYPIELPAMDSNKCYSVTLTVRRPGSSTPDVPVQKIDAVFDVQVLPWSENVSVDEII